LLKYEMYKGTKRLPKEVVIDAGLLAQKASAASVSTTDLILKN